MQGIAVFPVENADIADLATFHARWPDALEALITDRCPPEAYAELPAGPRAGIKPLMRFPDVP